MPRHYTDDEKRRVLERLIANHGDVARTAVECHIDVSTIYRWQKRAELQISDASHLQYLQQLESPALRSGEGLGEGSALPTETAAAFQTLHDKLLTIIHTLSNRIEEAIDEAPLNQRVTALSQLIDRIAKLAAMLPEDDDPDPSGKPFEIDYDIEEDDDDQEEEPPYPPAQAPSQPEEDSTKQRPF